MMNVRTSRIWCNCLGIFSVERLEAGEEVRGGLMGSEFGPAASCFLVLVPSFIYHVFPMRFLGVRVVETDVLVY